MAVCGIGLGHVTRSVEVSEELVRRGHSVFFTAYDQAYTYLVKTGRSPAKVMKVGYGVGADGTISVKKTLHANVTLPIKFTAQTMSEIALIGEDEADVVLSDTRASATLAAAVLRKPVATILNQYNVKLQSSNHPKLAAFAEKAIQAPQIIWNMSNIIIVPDLPPPYTISDATLQFPEKIREKILYTGPLIEIKQASKTEVEKIREQHEASDKPLVLVVISGGVEEKKSFVEKLVSLADGLGMDFSYVVSTADVEANSEIRKGPMILKSWITDLDAYIQAADVVVCRAGQTMIWRCILYEKPMVLIPTPHHGEQVSNAYKAERLGIGQVLDQSNLNASDLKTAVASVLDNGDVRYHLSALNRLSRGLGGVRAAASAVEELGR
ncbi:MAG: hypothetical protein NZ956_01130 [Candidatus Caldarchaeum sp.]|nr:hypothetical protein [Candidatus Caldarchaeum sp.]